MKTAIAVPTIRRRKTGKSELRVCKNRIHDGTTDSGLQFFGRSDWHADKGDLSFTFGPESIYRMEPRSFFVWGSRGVPVAMRGGDGPDGQTPARPLDAQENFVEECEDVILEFTALGNAAAEAHYREMASSNANWPHLAT